MVVVIVVGVVTLLVIYDVAQWLRARARKGHGRWE